jgi:hypothetical protein
MARPAAHGVWLTCRPSTLRSKTPFRYPRIGWFGWTRAVLRYQADGVGRSALARVDIKEGLPTNTNDPVEITLVDGDLSGQLRIAEGHCWLHKP